MAEPPREKAAQATDGTSGTTSDSAGSSSGSVSPDITGDAAQLRNVNVAALEIAVSGAIPARCPFSGMPLTGMSLSRRSGDCADELLTAAEMHIQQRISVARKEGLRRRLRIAGILVALMGTEYLLHHAVFDAYLERWASQQRVDTILDISSQFGVHRFSYGSALHFVLLALVPTDVKLIRLQAALMSASSLGLWIADVYDALRCRGAGEHPIYPTYPWCAYSGDTSVTLPSRLQIWMLASRLVAGSMFLILFLLSLRALSIRFHRVGGDLHVWWRHPPHVALQQLWRTIQIALIWTAVIFACATIFACAVKLESLGEQLYNRNSSSVSLDEDELEDPVLRRRLLLIIYLAVRAVYCLIHLVFAYSPVRRRVQAFLGSSCLPVCGNDEVCAYRTIVGLLGSGHVPAALCQARYRFRAVKCDVITSDAMLRNRHDGSQQALCTQHVKVLPLGECDAFISHAWVDPPRARLRALHRWHAAFKAEHDGSSANVWFDQFCVDPMSMQADLACLGAFIAGCKQFVLLASPSFATRLWCVLEMVTFLEMGGTLHDLIVVPLLTTQEDFIEQHRPATAATASSSSSSEEPSPPADATEELPSVSPDSVELYSEAAASDDAQTASTEHLAEEATAEELRAACVAGIEPLTRFDVRLCACYCPNDFSALLASIESAFGSHHDFNRKVRLVGAELLEAVTSPTQRRPHSLQKVLKQRRKCPFSR